MKCIILKTYYALGENTENEGTFIKCPNNDRIEWIQNRQSQLKDYM